MTPDTGQPPITTAAPNVAPESNLVFGLGVTTLALVLLVWGIVFLLGQSRTGQLNNARANSASLDSKISSPSLAQTLTTYIDLDTIASQMASVRNQRVQFLPTWQAIKASVPKDVQFLSMSMDASGNFGINCQSKSIASVANFTTALGQQAGLSDIQLSSISKGGIGYTFSVALKATAPKASS